MNFTISPRVISHLGEDLIKNESIALLELVKNSYDACATECNVFFHFDNEILKKIIIQDNGFGMNYDIIKNIWLNIGTEFKKNVTPSKCGRYPLGEKGIGRLGVHKLGNMIELISKNSNDPEIVVNIDWTKLDKALVIDDFGIEVQERVSPKTFKLTTGTKIIITSLKSEWSKKQLREVYRNLMALNSPFSENSNDKFKVNISSNNNYFENLPDLDDIKNSGMYFGQCTLEGNKITQFNYSFKPWQSLTKVEQGRSISENDLLNEDKLLKDKDNKEIDLNDLKIGKIVFNLIIYETDSQIFSFVQAERKTLRTFLSENGGIRVYRDNIRVYDYGEPDDDWLGIDIRRVSRLGGNVSNNILIGAVMLERKASIGLKEKTNREGFIENKAYWGLVAAIDYCLSIFVRERNIDKRCLTTLYKKHKVVEPVLSDLDSAIGLIQEGGDKDKILKHLYRVNEQYKAVRDTLIKSANVGLNLGMIVHEINKLLSALMNAAQKNLTKDVIIISERLDKIINKYSLLLKKTNIDNYSLISIIDTAVDTYEFRFTDHKIKIVKNYLNLNAYLSEAEAVSALLNLFDNAIYWLEYGKIKEKKIFIHLTDKIQGYNSIIVTDNGPDFNIPYEIAVEPFITGKPFNEGTGLGLHVIKETMNLMGGQLLFLDELDGIKNKNILIALCFRKKK